MFLTMVSKNDTKAWATKEKIDELDFIKIKTLCCQGYHQESEKITNSTEKTFTNHTSDKGFVCRIYEDL